MTKKVVANADAGDADTVGGDDWDGITGAINAAGEHHTYLVYKDGSNFVAKKDNWDLESTNTDALTVLQYAVDNAATRRGLVIIKGEKGKWYNLTGSLSLVDKNVTLRGLYNPASISATAVENSVDDYGGVVFKKNFATTAPIIDMRNTVWTKNSISNISVVGNATASDYGIMISDGREKQPMLENVWITGVDTGLDITKAWHADLYNLNIYSCTTTGMHLHGTGANLINTLQFYGGRIISSPTNIWLDNTCNDVQFFGINVEGKATGNVACIKTHANSNHCCFWGGSLEKNGESAAIIIDESGNNNMYNGMRFDSDTDYIPFKVRSGAKNNVIENCFFQANAANVVATITLDSGSINTGIFTLRKSTNTVGSVVLADSSGGSYNALGNISLLGATNLTRSTLSPLPSKGYSALANNGRLIGLYNAAGNAAAYGLLSGWTAGVAAGFTTLAAADGNKGLKFTPAASIGAVGGIRSATQLTFRQWNPRIKCKFRLDNKADTRLYIGFNAAGAANTGDDPYNAAAGIAFGKIADATDANWCIMHNDTSGATVIADLTAADNAIHQIEIRADDANSKFWYSFDNAAEVGISTDIPAQTTALGALAWVETTNTTQPLFHIFWLEMESG